MSENRRQWVLLGVLGSLVVIYFAFGDFSGDSSGSAGASMDPIDVAGLAGRLQQISTVNPMLIGAERGDSVPDRNLFQYGQKKPPPPDPEEMERRRRLAEEELKRQEERARALAVQQEMQRQMNVQANPPPQVMPPKPQPPPAPAVPQPPQFDFRFMGIVGSAKARIGVFVKGENVTLARTGTIIEDKFRVIDIGVAWADIGYTDPVHKDARKRVHFGL
jgi:hypothetical protein